MLPVRMSPWWCERWLSWSCNGSSGWSASAHRRTTRTWRSRCCATSYWCYAGGWPGPGTHRPTAQCSRALAKVLPRHRWPIFLVTPSTLLRCIGSWCGAGGPIPIPAGVHHALCVRTWSRSWFGWPGRNPLGIPAHRRRVPQTRHPRFGDIVAHDPAPARSLAGTAARRAELDPVPAHPGCRGARV